MLFSQRARVNGPAFLLGWVVAVAIVSGVAYTLADQADAATSSTAADTIAWGKIVFGVLFLLLAFAIGEPSGARTQPDDAEVDGAALTSSRPRKAFGLGLLLAGVNPKNLMLAAAAGAGARGARTLNRRGRRLADRLRRHRQRHDRRAGPLLPVRRRPAQGLDWASSRTGSPAQQRCHGGPVPRLRRQAHRRRIVTTRLKTAARRCPDCRVAPGHPRRRPAKAGLLRERLKGLEPSTFCMASRRSSQLSYSRV